MTDYVPTQSSTQTPTWTGRNKKISSFIEHNKNVLDLGCGSKDLLNYITPKNYIGVDYNQPLADIQINLNKDFTIPTGTWDYIISSGVLEYLSDLTHFFSKIKNNSNNYIFTFWKDADKSTSIKNPHLYSVDKVISSINDNFSVIKTDSFKRHLIFICKDKNNV